MSGSWEALRGERTSLRGGEKRGTPGPPPQGEEGGEWGAMGGGQQARRLSPEPAGGPSRLPVLKRHRQRRVCPRQRVHGAAGRSRGSFVRRFGGFAGIQTAATASAIFASAGGEAAEGATEESQERAR